MTEQNKLTITQFKNQLKLLLRPVKQTIVDLIDKPVEGISIKIENNIYTLDGMPLSIEGNEQLKELGLTIGKVFVQNEVLYIFGQIQ